MAVDEPDLSWKKLKMLCMFFALPTCSLVVRRSIHFNTTGDKLGHAGLHTAPKWRRQAITMSSKIWKESHIMRHLQPYVNKAWFCFGVGNDYSSDKLIRCYKCAANVNWLITLCWVLCGACEPCKAFRCWREHTEKSKRHVRLYKCVLAESECSVCACGGGALAEQHYSC